MLDTPSDDASTARAEIVCICGSMRFLADMRAAHRRLSLAGVIGLTPCDPGDPQQTVTPAEKAALAAIHLRKIDLADRVLVVNPGGYIGESTRLEIEHARAAGKPVSFTHADT